MRPPRILAALAVLLIATATFIAPARAEAVNAYDVWVQGVRVTSDNQSDVLGDGTVRFVPNDTSNGTLYLKNADIGVANDPMRIADISGIYSDINLTLVLEGENRIIARNAQGDPLHGTYLNGICASGCNLIIEGDGKLYVDMFEGTDFPKPSGVYGIYAGPVTIRDGAFVDVNVDESGGPEPAYNTYGISCADLDVDGAYVSTLADSGRAYSFGISATNINVTDGYVFAASNGAGTNGAAIIAFADIRIDGASYVHAYAASHDAIYGDNVTLADNATVYAVGDYGVRCIADGSIKLSDDTFLEAIGYYRALTETPDATGHVNPGAFVSTSSYGEGAALLYPVGGDFSSYGYVRIPAAGTIARIAGEYANETSALISRATFNSLLMEQSWSDYIVLARDDDFADALGATGLAGVLNAPIILTDRESLSPAAAAEINRLDAETVYIIGGTGAMKQQLETDLQEQCGIAKSQIVRIWGENSYDTSLECAKWVVSLGGTDDGAIIAMSTNFQDALSMSPIAYSHGVPVILQTWGDTSADRGFTDDAKEFLSGKSLIVAGGPGAISDASLDGFTVFRRIYGETGYDTSNEIAKWATEGHWLNTYNAVIACGAQAPKGTDALAGAALAGRLRAPILLVNSNEAMEAANLTTIDGYLSDHEGDVREAIVLGGTYVVPQELYDVIKTKLGGAHDISAMLQNVR